MALPVLPGRLPGLLPDSFPPPPVPGVTVAGSGGYSVSNTAQTGVPVPGTVSLSFPVNNTDGHWMIAVITWRDTPGYVPPTFTVADDVHNWWEPLNAGSSMSSASGLVRCSVWMAPAARKVTTGPGAKPGSVYISPSGFTVAFAAIIYDVAGMAPWVNTAAATAFANSGTSVSVPLAAPFAQAVAVTVCGWDNLAVTPSLAAGGWSSQFTVTTSNGTDSTSDLGCSAALQITTGPVTASWSSGTVNLAAAAGSVLMNAPALAQLSPRWPVTIFEMAPGSGFQTAPDRMTWTPVTTSALDMAITQGKQFEAQELATGEGTLYLDNPAGMFTPPGSGSLAGVTSGTPVRQRCAWTGGSWQLSLTGNGVSAPSMSTANIFTVTPGVTYHTAAWLGSSAAWASGFVVTLTFVDGSSHAINSYTSPPVTGPLAVLATASGVAPANAVTASASVTVLGIPAPAVTFYAAATQSGAAQPGYLTVPAGSAWTAGGGATVTVLAPWQPDPNGPPNITPWYVPYSGFIERLPQGWDDLLRGFTEATITDAWFAVNFNLQPILATEILDDDPAGYWPATDPAGSAVASNVSVGSDNPSAASVTPLTVTQSKYGSGNSKEAFGASPPGQLIGAQSTLVVSPQFRLSSGAGMWQQTLPVNAFGSSQGFALDIISGSFPPVKQGVTIEFWFQPAVTAAGGFPTGPQVLMNLAGSGGDILQVGLNLATAGTNPGALLMGSNIDISTGPFTPVVPSAVNYQTGTPPMTQFVLTFNRTTYSTYVNGQPTLLGGTWSSLLVPGAFPPSFTQMSFGGDARGFPPPALLIIQPFTFFAYCGFIGQIAIFPYLLPVSRIQSHYHAGIAGMAGDLSGNRVQRLLQAANSTGRRAIGGQGGIYATKVVSCQDIPAQPASQAISNITQDLQPGLFYIAPTGDITGLARQASWNQPVRWVLGEEGYAGEYQYTGDIGFDFDPTRLQNQIQLTQLDNQDIVVPTVTALETTSQAQYGTVSNFATGYLQGDLTQPLNFGPGLQDLANWLATTNAAPALRLSSVTVDAASDARRWPFVLGASVGDIVQVNRRPVGSGGLTIPVTGRITQTERQFSYGKNGVKASVTCLIDNAPEAFALQLDNVVTGTLNGLNRLAWL